MHCNKSLDEDRFLDDKAFTSTYNLTNPCMNFQARAKAIVDRRTRKVAIDDAPSNQ